MRNTGCDREGNSRVFGRRPWLQPRPTPSRPLLMAALLRGRGGGRFFSSPMTGR